MKIILSLALAGAMLLSGCANHQPVTAPIVGATSQFDSDAYQTLAVAHGIAKSLSDQAKAGTYKPSPSEKVIVNQFIADLNTADIVYAGYHNGAKTQAEAQAAIARVQTDQANLPTLGGK